MEVLFTSERLLFRKFTEEDDHLIYDLNIDPEITKYLHEEPTTKERAKHILNNIILPQYTLYNHGRWAVHLKAGNEFIGWCGLKYRPELDKIDLGYRYMKNSWGHGYATEAARQTIQYGFLELSLKEIFAATHVENIASQRVIEKCGMEFTGYNTIDHCRVKTYSIINKI
ncbi:MAG TPA: GNAT family N-acetyltransferase [Segetibacter sp.]